MAGMLGHLGIGKETTWGTAVAATDYIEAMSESLATEIERFDTRNIVGGIYEADDSAGVRRHAGDLVFAANPGNLGPFLLGAFGVNSVTELAVGALFENHFTQTGVLTGSLNPLPSYTAEIFRPGGVDISSSFVYSGLQFNTLQIAVSPNQDVRITAGAIGKAQTFITKTTPTFPNSPLQPFTFDTASVSIAGVAVTRVEALTFDYNNNLEGIPTLNNDTEIAKIRRNGPATTEISGTLEFEDHTDFNRFISQSEHAIALNVVRASSFALLVEVPRAVLTAYPVSIPGRERLTVDFSMKGRYETGSGTAFSVKLTTTNTY